MKKFAMLACSALMAVALGSGIVGCAPNPEVKVGEYSYNVPAWNTTYGAKVRVSVVNDVVKEVKMLDLGDWVDVTASWDGAGKQVYLNSLNSMLSAYSGHRVEEIMSWTVTKDAGGAPTKIEGAIDEVMASGATQSSGRLLLAVQNALSQLPGQM